MSEFVSSWHFTEKDRHNIEEIEQETLEIVDRTYGSGYPDFRPGEDELAYHNGHHARVVGRGAVRICERIGLTPELQVIARSAGYAHDIVFGRGRGVDEAMSAEWLEEQLREKAALPASMRRMAAMAILATEPVFTDGRITGQVADRLEYPDLETEMVARSVASADLGELYVPEGPYLGHQLFREINGMPANEDVPFEKLPGFQRRQLELLETYRYPLDGAEEILATHKSEVISYAADLLEKLEDGSVESWQEVLNRDMEFMQRHGSE